MDYNGLVLKYPINRLLTEQERQQQLKQSERLNTKPLYQLCVIKLNSTYLESVDKWFAWKGMLSAIVFAFLALFAGKVGWHAFNSLLQGLGLLPSTYDRDGMLTSGFVALTVVALVTWGLCWLLCKESFAFTHYPMRFDRKARMVHVFRPNGTTLSTSWDSIFFTLGYMAQWQEWEVRGHVLKPDGVTVEETFALSFIGTYDASAAPYRHDRIAAEDYLRAHWEFIRRYMEEGPEAVADQVQFCMPISERKETFANGIERICANIAGAPGLLYWMIWPFCMVAGVFRAFAMATSKIPHFPPEVEAMSKIEVDDPYAIEGDETGERIPVYPTAANSAGVRFGGPS